MEQWEMTSHSVAETQQLASRFARIVRPGDVLALNGDLGAGKTTFTQGFARELGIQEQVNSPSFTLIKEYEGGRLPLYHMDLYRLHDVEEALFLGIEEYFAGEGVCVVEWAERINDALPDDAIRIELLHMEPELRRVRARSNGKVGMRRIKELSQA